MRVIDDLNRISSIIRGLKPVQGCPKGTDMPCVFCLECDKADYDEIEYDDGLLKITRNSVILNMKVNVGESDVDKALVRELLRALASTYSFIMDKPEEGYDLSFFFFHTDKDSVPIFEQVIRILPEFNRLLTEGRMVLKNWARNAIKKLLG